MTEPTHPPCPKGPRFRQYDFGKWEFLDADDIWHPIHLMTWPPNAGPLNSMRMRNCANEAIETIENCEEWPEQYENQGFVLPWYGWQNAWRAWRDGRNAK